MNWLTVFGALLQVVFIILSNWSKHKDKTEEEKNALKKEWEDVIASGDKSRINAFIERIRLHK